MPRDVIYELLHGVNSTSRWFRNRFPDEEIVFASPASYAEAREGTRPGRGRRGVIIVTPRQIFFKSVLFSLYTLLFLGVGFACFAAYAKTEDVFILIIGILAVASTFNRLPLERQILLGDIENVKIGSVGGLTLRGIKESPILSINTLGNQVKLTLNRALTEDAKQILGVPNAATDDHTRPLSEES